MRSFRSKPVGWRGDSYRHYLAAKGVKTRYNASIKSRLAGTDVIGKEHKEVFRKGAIDIGEEGFDFKVREQANKMEFDAQRKKQKVREEMKGEKSVLSTPNREMDVPNERIFVEREDNLITAQEAKMFLSVARNQRGDPEDAYKDVASAHGGGVYANDIMHIGDLTHRMSEMPDFRPYKAGYENVKTKVENLLRSLDSDGYESRMYENADYYEAEEGLSKKDYVKRIDDARKKYVEAHKNIPVFNDAQKTAQQAAIAFGELRFDDAKMYLKKLKVELDKGKDSWEIYARET